jgi:hypothetical protein
MSKRKIEENEVRANKVNPAAKRIREQDNNHDDTIDVPTPAVVPAQAAATPVIPGSPMDISNTPARTPVTHAVVAPAEVETPSHQLANALDELHLASPAPTQPGTPVAHAVVAPAEVETPSHQLANALEGLNIASPAPTQPATPGSAAMVISNTPAQTAGTPGSAAMVISNTPAQTAGTPGVPMSVVHTPALGGLPFPYIAAPEAPGINTNLGGRLLHDDSPATAAQSPASTTVEGIAMVPASAALGVPVPPNSPLSEEDSLNYSSDSSVGGYISSPSGSEHSRSFDRSFASSAQLDMSTLDDFRDPPVVEAVDPAEYHLAGSSSDIPLIPNEIHMIANAMGIDLPHIAFSGLATSALALLLTVEC